MERQYGVTARWKPGDKPYEVMKSCLLVENQIRVRATLWSCVVKRHYLLCMKAKYAGRALMFTKKKIFNVFLYADGQNIAKKLCSGISKETRVPDIYWRSSVEAPIITTFCLLVISYTCKLLSSK